MITGIHPAFFEKTASTQIKKIHGAMINRK